MATKRQHRHGELRDILEGGLALAEEKLRVKKIGLRESSQEGRPHLRNQHGDDTVPGLDLTVDLAIIQIKSGEIARYQDSLKRLAEGSYGVCSSCRGEIASNRLKALPLAVRCRECEETRENGHLGQKHLIDMGSLSLDE